MNALQLILRSVAYHRRAHLGLLAGTALAAAILTGALAVGDSVAHTLGTYAMQRLGSAEVAITSGDRLFDDSLGPALRTQTKSPVAVVLALPGMAISQNVETGKRTQVNKVQALGVGNEFWEFADGAAIELGKRDCALDARLANLLGVKPGDSVALRISKPGLLSRDAPLSSREEESSSRANFTVKAIAGDAQMGRFSLAANQIPPYNFFVNIADLQQLASSETQANLILGGATANGMEAALNAAWKPEHAGLKVEKRSEKTLQLESSRIFFDDATAKAALGLPGAQGALTYLVNGISSGSKLTPYSFMTAGSPLTTDLRDDEIALNAWAAAQLNANEGARVTVTYYEVLPSNKFVERSRDFTVKRVVPMADLADEKALVPNFPGLSNVESCKDWKIGMPMDEQLLKDEANEAYWKEFKQTPKAFVTLKSGQSMWANRFGGLTAVRFAADATTPDAIMQGLAKQMNPAQAGLAVRAVREDAAKAVAQSQDLGGLFLGMSFFLLGSALTLTGLIYAFGVQQRAEELGVLAAIGYTRGRVRVLMLGEAALVALPGATLGALLGIAYAWALMFGLANYWQDAVGRIPILFDIQAKSIAIGIVATIVCALFTAFFTLRRLLRHSANELMHADFTQAYRARKPGKVALGIGVICLLGALGMAAYGLVSPPADPAETFFSSGASALIAGLCFTWRALCGFGFQPKGAGLSNPFRLSLLNAARRRGRSLGIVSSLAAGGFLVLAVSAMQSDTSANADQRWSGTGGFALYGDATVPILDPALLAKAAPAVSAIGLRVFDGDDASCLNLNQAIRPRVLGVDEKALAELKAFTDASGTPLWQLLEQDLGPGVVPALVGDSDTAMWTLKKKTGPKGDTLTYRNEAGNDVQVKLVGRLPMRLSIFQGAILISAKRFTELWPSQEGFRVFLIDAPADGQAEVVDRLQSKFDRHGLDVTTSVSRLEMFHAVEGTYLSMFLVLGGVGWLLGATATGIVVLRNLLERRREIALLRAVGFAPRAVFHLLAYEYGFLLAIGACIGAAASVLAMLPALSGAHGGASVLWRLAVFAFVLGGAALCTALALRTGLRRTDVTALRAE